MQLPDRPETQVWFRNAGAYVQQLAELGCYNVVFDENYLLKRKIDPIAFCSLRFGSTAKWRCLVIGKQDALLFEAGSSTPNQIFPVWSADRHAESTLVKYMKNAGKGQSPIIVISDLPDLSNTTSKMFLMELSEFQAEHPEVTFFIHGLYSYSGMFSNSFRMVDCDARKVASQGRIQLPFGGKTVYPSDLSRDYFWVHVLGNDLKDLQDPKERCKYNIKSAIFAGTYWKHLYKFAMPPGQHYLRPDWDSPAVEAAIKEGSLIYTKRLVERPGDRIVCDDCSLWLSCKYFREGSVCAVPESDMQKVAKMFGTRNSLDIQKALAALVQANTERIERGMKAEATPIPSKDGESDPVDKEVDPNLSKLIADTFKMGDRLLQIADPAFRPGRGSVNVSVTGAAQRVEIGTGRVDDQEMVSTVIGMLEARGIRREDITEEMVNLAMAEIAKNNSIRGEIEA